MMETFGAVDLIHATTAEPVRRVALSRDDAGRWWLDASYDMLGLHGFPVGDDTHPVNQEEESDWEGEPPDD